MTFDEWLKYGIDKNYCTEQFCNVHSGAPMSTEEEDAWERGFDPCAHVVRLGTEKDWNKNITGLCLEAME